MSTLFEELSRVTTYEYTQDEVREFESLHEEIRKLKKERNAVIVAHNYYRPEILKVADFVGDSLELALMASKVKDADVIEFAGVHFMAETAKIVNPTKTVLLPNKNILFVPDRNLANHVAEQVPEKNIIPWDGYCYVHQQITPEEIAKIREADPDLDILVHPECRPDVAKLADAVLSTSGMVRYAKERPATRFLIVTECGLSDRLAMEVPDKTFLKGCKLCAFMKVTTLEDVRDSLLYLRYEVEVPEEIRVPAERALRRMFDVTG